MYYPTIIYVGGFTILVVFLIPIYQQGFWVDAYQYLHHKSTSYINVNNPYKRTVGSPLDNIYYLSRTGRIRHASATVATTTSTSSALRIVHILRITALEARRYSDRTYYDDDDERYGDEYIRQQQQQKQKQRVPITETRADRIGPGNAIPKPKIVVLGASGKVGRLVVRQLLDMSNLDATIVAFCRDYDKACRVLYDDIIVIERNSKGKGNGPRLQIIQGNLVPPQILPKRNKNEEENDDDDDDEEEREWIKRAESAAKFYGSKIIDYDNRLNITSKTTMDSYEALQDAIQDCTAIISCIGSVRVTNVWTDFIQFPLWRVLHRDVSSWCTDPNHPYYVHYASTSKVLQYAEKEQLRRDAAALASMSITDTDNEIDFDNNSELSLPPRIRFIRISDLVCSQQPWHIIPVVTNIVQSMVIRYHAMSEKILQSSTVIDTINIRPGDLTDDQRDESTTNIEISPTGSLTCPARIGRDDVAATAIAAALLDFTTTNNKDGDALFHHEKKSRSMVRYQQQQQQAQARPNRPFHFTLACRWTGNELDPYPAQGLKSDGHPNAFMSLKAAMPALQRQARRKQQLQQEHVGQSKSIILNGLKDKGREKTITGPLPSLPLPSNSHRRNEFARQIKPYGICVAVPVYLLLLIVCRSIVQGTVQFIPGLQQVSPVLVKIIKAVFRGIILFVGRILHTKWIPLWNILNLHRTSPNYISF